MSTDHTLLAHAHSELMARAVAKQVAVESCKGCSDNLSDLPVGLEPPFTPILAQTTAIPEYPDAAEQAFSLDPMVRLRLWIAAEQKADWNRAELFLKQLACLGHRLGFEIVGNREEIAVCVLCHEHDVPVVWTAFEAQFENCEISWMTDSPLASLPCSDWSKARFRDFYPSPPYSHLLTSLSEIKTTPFATLLMAMSRIPKGAVGVYQCLFAPVSPQHNWHLNVELLLDLEYRLKLNRGFSGRGFQQQAPSGDLKAMAQDVETKAHNDKPFFGTAVRIGMVGEGADRLFAPLCACMSLFQHGGRPLNWLGEAAYRAVLSGDSVREMFLQGLSYRPGFLANSRELAGLVHVFPIETLKRRRLPLGPLELLAKLDDGLLAGTPVGSAEYAGRRERVCIPHTERLKSTHIVAQMGHGKSVVLENMCLHDIEEGRGVIFLDPHGDTIKRLLDRIPPESADRCIYFNPGDPEWIPLWNPLHLRPGGNRYFLAGNVISALRHVCRDWGDRLEHVLRNGLLGLSYLKQPCLLDLYMLTRQKSDESARLRKEILDVAIDDPVRAFWEHDFVKDYRPDHLQSLKHKLSKLVSAGSVSMMLAQPESNINLRQIMDDGMVLLVDLSSLDSEVGGTIGGLILALLLNETKGRSDTAADRRHPSSLFVDEAPRFVAGESIEELITQARKFNTNLCLAHQYLRQFGVAKVDALSIVGTTLIGRVDKHDAQYLAKDLHDSIDPVDLTKLEKRTMIGHIGNQVVKFRTEEARDPVEPSCAQQIIASSHRRYCKRASELQRERGKVARLVRMVEEDGLLNDENGELVFSEEDLFYDEF